MESDIPSVQEKLYASTFGTPPESFADEERVYALFLEAQFVSPNYINEWDKLRDIMNWMKQPICDVKIESRLQRRECQKLSPPMSESDVLTIEEKWGRNLDPFLREYLLNVSSECPLYSGSPPISIEGDKILISQNLRLHATVRLNSVNRIEVLTEGPGHRQIFAAKGTFRNYLFKRLLTKVERVKFLMRHDLNKEANEIGRARRLELKKNNQIAAAVHARALRLEEK